MAGCGTDKTRVIFSALFLEEKYFLKIVCFCCTGLLLVQVFHSFFIDKPTVSSVEKTNLSRIYFPDVIVCFEEGFDEEKLKQYGYADSFRYYLGFHPDKFIGWSGRNNEDPHRQDSSILKRKSLLIY